MDMMERNDNFYAPFTEQTFQQFTQWLDSPDHKNRVCESLGCPDSISIAKKLIVHGFIVAL